MSFSRHLHLVLLKKTSSERGNGFFLILYSLLYLFFPAELWFQTKHKKNMAGTKETPRQKMIGMMYLVLTALLALQVSSAMIYKFQTLNESLEKSSRSTNSWTESRLEFMKEEVKRRGDRPDEVKHLSSAETISEQSRIMFNYIEHLKKELIKETGGYDEEGNLKGAKEETAVEVMMIGQNKNGKAYELKEKLEGYREFINSVSSIKFSPLALDGKDDPMFMNNSDQRNKDFAELNFGQTPLVAGLAILSEIQSRIASMESATVTELVEKVAKFDYKFDKLTPMVAPASRIVPAGTKYEAQLFMTATSSTLKPEMELEETPLSVNDQGVALVSFTASGGNYGPDDLVKKTWTGKIKMQKPGGGDTLYTVTEEYYVARPVIQVQTGTLPGLYRNCGNKLNIQVPALGSSYNPSFVAEGANVYPGEKRGFITVVPTGANVKVKVNSGGNFLGEEKFKVRLIPLPAIDVKINGERIDPVKGIDKDKLRRLAVKAIPDKEFYEFLPDDAIYKITEYTVELYSRRSLRGALKPQTEICDISQLKDLAQPGDRVIVEIKKVKRKNFRGEWEDVNIPTTIIVIPVV